MPDPYDWNPPDLPPEQMTDADWLRSRARANFIESDIERADRIARSLEVIPRTLAVLRADLDETARAVAADVADERDHLKAQLADLATQYEHRLRERDDAIERARHLQYAIESLRSVTPSR